MHRTPASGGSVHSEFQIRDSILLADASVLRCTGFRPTGIIDTPRTTAFERRADSPSLAGAIDAARRRRSLLADLRDRRRNDTV